MRITKPTDLNALMTPQERELWMTSKQAPEGMMMIHESEMANIQGYLKSLTEERMSVVSVLGRLYDPKKWPSIVPPVAMLVKYYQAMQEKAAKATPVAPAP